MLKFLLEDHNLINITLSYIFIKNYSKCKSFSLKINSDIHHHLPNKMLFAQFYLSLLFLIEYLRWFFKDLITRSCT